VISTYSHQQQPAALQASIPPADASTESCLSEPSTSGLISYNFISDPVKKAFFETSAPAADVPQVMYDRPDVDINLEAKINQ